MRWLSRQWIAVVLVTTALVCSGALLVRTRSLEARLVRTWPDEVLMDSALVRFAEARAPSWYGEYCSACHGPKLEGDRARGVPSLADNVWLYGGGSITDIETTILYGIRSGHPKAHNLTDMPAFGRNGQLTIQDIRDVVEYVLLMSGQPHEAAAAERGRSIYHDAGVCYDCHAADGYGISDYGTPALTGRGGSWIYGGDRATLYQSVYDGRHGLCPAWIGKLSFVQIRALSVYLYEVSHRE